MSASPGSRLQQLAAQAAAEAARAAAPRRAIGGWQDVIDAVRIHAVTRRLRVRFDPEGLRADLAGVDEAWWSRHQGPYHDGAWEAVALWAPRGDRREQRSSGGAFGPTEALARCPHVGQVLDALPGDRNRVRFMRLRAGGHILRHSDPMHQIDRHLVRLHVPVVTSPAVKFLVRDRPVVMKPGEVWHVDVRFPHEVHNQGTDHRVHLVIDLVANPALEELFDQAECFGRGLLTGYYARHSLPEWARRRWRIGN